MYAALDAAPTSFFLAFGDSVQSSLFFLFTRAQHSCDFGFASCFLFNSFFFSMCLLSLFFFFSRDCRAGREEMFEKVGCAAGKD